MSNSSSRKNSRRQREQRKGRDEGNASEAAGPESVAPATVRSTSDGATTSPDRAASWLPHLIHVLFSKCFHGWSRPTWQDVTLWLAGPVLSGVLLVLCFPPYDQGWLVWIALAPILLTLRGSGSVARRPWRAGWLMGVVYFGGTFWWIGHVTAAGTAVLVVYLAIYPACWCWLVARKLAFRAPPDAPGLVEASLWFNLRGIALAPCAWVALEYGRGWFFTGFSWNYLGIAAQGNAALMQLASFGGVLLLSWLIVAVNYAVALTLARLPAENRGTVPRRPHYEIFVAILLVAFGFALGMRRLLTPPAGLEFALRYACVQGNVPLMRDDEDGMTDSEALQRYIDLSAKALEDPSKTQLLIWPESSMLADLRSMGREVSQQVDCYMLLGSSVAEGKNEYNAALLYSPRGRGEAIYHKNKLVIFGEYAPLSDYLPTRGLVPFKVDCSPGPGPGVFEIRDNPGDFVSDDFHTAGEVIGALPTGLIESNGMLRIAPLICFEDTSASYVREASYSAPDVLVNMTNDSWFADSPGAEQHLANARMRTVELGLPMIRCTNTGVTCEIDPYGRITAVLTDEHGKSVGVQGTLVRELRFHSLGGPTLYQRCGDWIALLSAAACVILLVCPRVAALLRPRGADS